MSSIIKCQAIAFLFCRCQYRRNLFHSGHAGSQFLQPFDFSTAKANNLNAAARSGIKQAAVQLQAANAFVGGLRFCRWSYFLVRLCLQIRINALLPFDSDSSQTGGNTSNESISQKFFFSLFFFVKIVCYSEAPRPPRGPRQDCMSLYSPSARGYLLHFTVTKQAAFNWQPSPLFVR